MTAISIATSLPRGFFLAAGRLVAICTLFSSLLLTLGTLRAEEENLADKSPATKDAPNAAAKDAPEKTAPPAAAPAAAKNGKKEKEEDKIPDPLDLTLITSDGLQLALTYYPSNQGKDAIPVVLLHAFGGSRTNYKDLAITLQSQGYAVIAPDLRGHGDSTKQKNGGKELSLNAAKLPVDQYKMMVDQDMYAIKEFLWAKNNVKELNLNKLAIVGAEMGASVAINFTALDATGYMRLGDSDRGPYYGTLQLGLFVKALVLLSPEISFKGLPLEIARQDDLRRTLPVLILVGKDDPKSLNEAERVNKIFKRLPQKKIEDSTLLFQPLKTKLQGTNLLESKTLYADAMICRFLEQRLIKADQAKDWTWKTLKKPHE